MKSSRKILISLLSVALAVNGLSGEQNNPKENVVKANQALDWNVPIPKSVRCFEKKDFDSRREYQEYLKLKHGDTLFWDTMCRILLPKNADIETVVAAMEFAALGRSVDSLRGMSVYKAAEKCGFKRLCAMLDFKKENKTGYFLDGKNEFDHCALAAEMMAFGV